MRKAKLFVVLGLLVCATLAIAGGIETSRLVISTGGLTYGSTTSVAVSGYLEEVYFDVPSAGTTGTVSVAWSPTLATMDPVTVATSTALTADKIIRPRVDGTSTDGTALTGDPPGRYLVGGTLTFAVTNASATNLQWTCIIKTSDK